jgi:hypothetical protein
MSLGMWQYYTLQSAVKTAASYLAVHGAGYVASAGAPIQIKNVANVLAKQAVGIAPNSVQVTFTANTVTRTCRLDTCQTDTMVWPPASVNAAGSDITITASRTFQSPFAMWTPGHSPVAFSNSYNFAGFAHQQIVF